MKAIKAEDGGAILTWETPTKGAHDGLLNSNSITYKIIRNPDNYTVIENLTTNTYTDYVTSGSVISHIPSFPYLMEVKELHLLPKH